MTFVNNVPPNEDPGGLIDVEFIVQALVLGHAAEHPELTANRGNIALLRMAAEAGLIPADLAVPVSLAVLGCLVILGDLEALDCLAAPEGLGVLAGPDCSIRRRIPPRGSLTHCGQHARCRIECCSRWG